MNLLAKTFLLTWARFLLLGLVSLTILGGFIGIGALLWQLIGAWSILLMAAIVVSGICALGYTGLQVQDAKEKAETEQFHKKWGR